MIFPAVTDIAKYSSGQLRPNFVKACQPSVELSSCSDGQYITNFTCLAVDQMEEYELRSSFPSAHASGAAFAATYLSVSAADWTRLWRFIFFWFSYREKWQSLCLLIV